MGFSHANSAINKERIIGSSRLSGDRHRRGVRHFIGGGNSKGIESLVQTQASSLRLIAGAIDGHGLNGGGGEEVTAICVAV